MESEMTKAMKQSEAQSIRIKPPNIQTVPFEMVGTAPYVQNRFGQKAIAQMMAKHMAGDDDKTKRNRGKKDFDALYEGAKHVAGEGWCGFPANGLRAAMISACRLVGFKMTISKISVF